MREIDVSQIAETVKDLCISANTQLPNDLMACISCAHNCEQNALAKDVIGMACVFLEIGQDVHIVGGSLRAAIDRGVALGYTEGQLRCSMVSDPLRRVNTNNNTPAILHIDIVEGDACEITVAPKGFGSENMSRVYMLTPAANRQTIIDKVCETVRSAGSNPCPPLVLGIGIGGNFEQVTYLAKKALCRPVSQANADNYYAKLEQDILGAVNQLNIGPQGFGGQTTALSVMIEAAPTHIAGLPLAINVGCHVTRHATASI